MVRQWVKCREAPGKTLSLFADDPDIQEWRYSALVTTLELPMVEIWRTYRGEPICTHSVRRVRYRDIPHDYRIKELKADFGLDAFNLRDFRATEAALGVAMLWPYTT